MAERVSISDYDKQEFIKQIINMLTQEEELREHHDAMIEMSKKAKVSYNGIHIVLALFAVMMVSILVHPAASIVVAALIVIAAYSLNSASRGYLAEAQYRRRRHGELCDQINTLKRSVPETELDDILEELPNESQNRLIDIDCNSSSLLQTP